MAGSGVKEELGVVIPALDEAEALPLLLDDLAAFKVRHRVLVVDGGSCDGTVAAARSGGAEVLRSRTGRSHQLNAGAQFLPTPWLLMLHADSRMGPRARAAVEGHIGSGSRSAAHLRFRVGHPAAFYRFLEAGQRLREVAFGLVYGDQGLLIRRDLFFQVGPYPDEPLMEDVILNRKLRKAGRLVGLPAPLETSPRRYEEEGRWSAWLRNTRIMISHLAGAPPSALIRHYPPRRAPSLAPRDEFRAVEGAELLIFAKAPRAGRVKTRLAAHVGAERAAEIYRRMGRLVVEQVSTVPVALTLCYDPPDGEARVREWLAGLAPTLVNQGSGDLGTRMSRMFARAFAHRDRVVVIGTDTPDVTAATVHMALDALEAADVVLGPSRDGGYYLLGLRAPCPQLFRGIPWSSAEVLEITVARARALGMAVTFLDVKADVDRVGDLTPHVVRWLGLPLRTYAGGADPLAGTPRKSREEVG